MWGSAGPAHTAEKQREPGSLGTGLQEVPLPFSAPPGADEAISEAGVLSTINSHCDE